jgi:hypothetical protein
MRKIKLISLLLFFSAYCIAQTISPDELAEYCPHPDFTNANIAQANLIYKFTLTFSSSASNYNVSSSPSKCKILQVTTSSSTMDVWVAFEDQRAVVPSFKITGPENYSKTFSFPYIRSIIGLKPVFIFPILSLPLCTTGNITYNTDKLVKFRKNGSSSSSDDYGTNVPQYQYSVPEGWKVAGVTSTGPNNYILAGQNATISYDALHSGEVKIRATQYGTDCGAYATLAPGEWATITFTRPSFQLTANGSTSVALTCGSSASYTFAVNNNGQVPNCVTSYSWNLQSANNNWLYNGSPAPQVITTTTNSITLTQAACGDKPTNVSVTPSIGSQSFSTLTIPITISSPALSIAGANLVCQSENYTINNLPCNAYVSSWSLNDPNAAILTSNGNTATLEVRYAGVNVQLNATISGLCGQDPVTVSKMITMTAQPYLGTDLIQGLPQGTTFCIGTTFNCYSTAAPITATNWSVNGGIILSGQGTQYIYVQLDNTPGIFEVNNHYTDVCGFARTATITGYKVDNGCTGPPVETRMKNSANSTQKAGQSDIGLSIYPNPVDNTMNVQISNNINLNNTFIIINDLQGRCIFMKKATAFKNEISLSGYSSGVYIVEIWEGAKKMIVKKVIKK